MILFVVKRWDTYLLPFQRNFLSLNLISVYLQFDYINSFLGDHILDKLYFVVSYQWYTYNHINMYTYIWMNRFIDHQTRKHPIFLFIDCLIIYLIIKTLCSWPICCLHFTSWIRKSWTMIFELNRCQHFTPFRSFSAVFRWAACLQFWWKWPKGGKYWLLLSSGITMQLFLVQTIKCKTI